VRRNEARPARLPREASPAKVAKDDQDKNDDDDDPKPGHVILSLGRADSTTSQAVCATCAAHATSETARRSGNRAGGAAEGARRGRGPLGLSRTTLPTPRQGFLPGHELRHDEVVEDRLGAALPGVDEEADAIELTPTRLVLGSNKHLAVHRER
jgi:hypothetical protein